MQLPAAVKAKAARQSVYDAILAAPVIVLMADPDALVGEKDGIYSKASQSAGRSLNGVAVQVQNGATTGTLTASLSISGSSSRFHDVTLKHSLRLKFDGGAAAGAFLPGMDEQVLLRHPTQDSWAQGGRWSALRASARYFSDGMADQWLAARGHSHLKRRWVHVFLNQVYWGLYEAVEQQTAAEAGGTLLEPGSLGVTSPIHGTDSAWRKLMADALTLSRRSRQGEDVGEAWEALLGRLDAANLADYIALNIWLGNQDWPIQNYLISGEDGRFHFLSWDAEWVMPVEKLTFPSPLASVLNAGDGPAALFSLLCDAPAFRQILRSRLTLESGFDDVDFKKLTKDSAAGIRPLLTAEAARWGFAYEPGADHLARWEGNVDWVVDKWIPGRAAKVREEIEKHLKSIETSQAAAALRAANQPASKMPDEPVPFVAALSSPPVDRDGDGITDAWEIAQGLDPDDPGDAASDPDGDGQSNLEEFLRKRNPRVKDATPRPAASVLTGTFNRMEKPVIRRGKTVDQTQAELLKLVPSAEEGAPQAQDSKPDKKSN